MSVVEWIGKYLVKRKIKWRWRIEDSSTANNVLIMKDFAFENSVNLEGNNKFLLKIPLLSLLDCS